MTTKEELKKMRDNHPTPAEVRGLLENAREEGRKEGGEKRFPKMGKERLVVAFDVDDTLIIPSVAIFSDRDAPNYDNIAIYRWFQSQGHYMIVWSGGGTSYAQMWGEKLGLNADEYRTKAPDALVDLAFDDCDVKLATVNIKVKRVHNSVSREDWNKH